jgi:hypothetical protein
MSFFSFIAFGLIWRREQHSQSSWWMEMQDLTDRSPTALRTGSAVDLTNVGVPQCHKPIRSLRNKAFAGIVDDRGSDAWCGHWTAGLDKNSG